MMELDKWQQREARQYAAENGVSYEKAVFILFGGEDPDAEAAPVPEGEQGPADPDAVVLTK
jgi:hypothetical protein